MYTVASNQGCSPLALFLRYHSLAMRQSCRVLGTRQASAAPAICWQGLASLIPPVHTPALPPLHEGLHRLESRVARKEDGSVREKKINRE